VDCLDDRWLVLGGMAKRKPAARDESEDLVHVLIPLDEAHVLLGVAADLEDDERYAERARAFIFTRGELELLISDARLHPDRRVFYTLLGLASLRFGETSALKWQSYDTTLEPLGRLLIASSWCSSKPKEKSTKTEQPRSVPVHPVLATMLDEWKRAGWPIMMGHAPTPDHSVEARRASRTQSFTRAVSQRSRSARDAVAAAARP
jgi:integrase